MILDTSYLINLIQRQQPAFEKGVSLFESRTVRRVPVPVLFELWYGVEFLDDEDRRRRLRNALMGYPVVPLDESMSRRAAELLARADRAAGGSSGIEANDAYVAAAADRFDEPVLTANAADFEALGVAVEGF
ncbi:MAG: PIN domain-containing protein [Halobacteriales archaeon]|nr:PIN domain-containing protein [Halobacteriales archaeon]